MSKFISKKIFVDAGLIWIGDPCYIMGDDASSRVKDFGKDVAGKVMGENVSAPLGDGIGLCISSGYGDGCYPVDIEVNEEGRVTKATITFIDEEEEVLRRVYNSKEFKS